MVQESNATCLESWCMQMEAPFQADKVSEIGSASCDTCRATEQANLSSVYRIWKGLCGILCQCHLDDDQTRQELFSIGKQRTSAWAIASSVMVISGADTVFTLLCERKAFQRIKMVVSKCPKIKMKSGHPESNQGPSDCCMNLQSDALPTEL